MKLRAAALGLAAPVLAAQAWELRLEAPCLRGQDLPPAVVEGGGVLAAELRSGRGLIIGLHRRLLVAGPVLRFQAGLEVTRWQAQGDLRLDGRRSGTDLRQQGFGLGVDAQFWVPFTGIAGELGLVQRFQDYRFATAVGTSSQHLARTWLRAGVRWRVPAPALRPFLAASVQAPLGPGRPVRAAEGTVPAAALAIQGSGQEFDRLWSFGVGVGF